MERLKTGISGLDEMLLGGLPRKKHVALSGGPGSGKTSFGFEFIYRGAQQGENGLFITLMETEDELKENMQSTFVKFNDLEQLLKSNKMQVVKPERPDLEKVAEIVEQQVSKNNVKRVVLDSSTMVRMAFESETEYRQVLFDFLSLLRTLNCTMMMTVEMEKAGKEAVTFGIEHFVMDGVINLYSIEQGERRIRALEVFKMRGSDHSRELVPFKVTPEGIKIYTGEKVF